MSETPTPSPLKRAYQAIEEMRARLEAAEGRWREPIAITGIACRLPGGADSPEALWRLLIEGVDAVGEVPPERWDAEAYYDPDPRAAGKMNTRSGGFIRDVDRFDPRFFGIAPREAASMDPQQRFLLEVGWQALENAGEASLERLAGSATGVFVAITTSDYAQMQLDAAGIEGIGTYFASGSAHSIASGRLSYVLGLQGPSVSIDTACSSSLVAVHLARQSLLAGECRMALASGVSLMLTPQNGVTLSKYEFLAPDGRCKAFDAAANGFGRGEGCAAIVLKRLSDAVADGDRVWATIRGSAINQDGASSGLTAPNGPAQEAVLRAALASARVAPALVGYVEAHGTGTALGDPIEAQALGAVFGQDRPETQPLAIGSIKTNMGHLEAAAGIAGLIKLALMLRHGEIVPSLHFSEPSPHIPWSRLPLRVAIGRAPWPEINGRRIGGVSAFGFSGTNVHVVLEQAPKPETLQEHLERLRHLLCLAARSDAALRELAGRYAERLGASDAPLLADACFTANAGRSHFAHRLAAQATSAESLVASLRGFAAEGEAPNLIAGRCAEDEPPKVAFLFTGQGAQCAGMGRQLYDTQPTFRAAFDRCDAILQPLLDRPLREIVYPAHDRDAALIDQTRYAQPALFAFEYALSDLWRAWGVRPSFVLGHSLGEYVAACVAGVFSLEAALALVAERGRLMHELPGAGSMAAAAADERRVLDALGPEAHCVAIAALNGPANTVISGEAVAMEAAVARLEAQGIEAKPLRVSHAFHSPMVEPMLDAFERAAARVEYRAPRIRLVSNVTGRIARSGEVSCAPYWREHVRATVRFADSMQTLFDTGCRTFLEIGPHPVLLGMGQACADAPDAAAWLPTLRRGREDWLQALQSLGELYVRGARIDWLAFDRDYPRRKATLPTYPFERQRYWTKPSAAPLERRAGRASGAAMLGTRLRSPLSQAQFETQLGAGPTAFLLDHVVLGAPIVPGAAMLEAAQSAAFAILGTDRFSLQNITIQEAMPLGEEQLATMQTIVETGNADAMDFRILSLAPDGDADCWRLNASGSIVKAATQEAAASHSATSETLESVRERCANAIDIATFYDELRAIGLEFGPAFRTLEAIWSGEGEALGCARASEGDSAAFRFHPALLDGCIQVLCAAMRPPENSNGEREVYLPVAIEEFRLHAQARGRLWSHGVVERTDGGSLLGHVRLYDEDGTAVGELRAMRFVPADLSAVHGARAGESNDWLYHVAWRLLPPSPSAAPLGVEPLRLAERVGEQVDAVAGQHGIDRYDAATPRLGALCVRYLLRALDRLGSPLEEGQTLDVGSLIARAGVAPRYALLVERLFEFFEENEILSKESEGRWRVQAIPDWADAERSEEPSEADTAPCRLERTVLERCGESLAEVLRGEVDPVDLLFSGDAFETTERLYSETIPARAFNALARCALVEAIASLPDDAALRILEIGGGTGGTTAEALGALGQRDAEYVFTDLSPAFLSRAQQRFQDYPALRTRLLDIETDPERQGFAPESFHIVVAANVLHATTDLRRTMRHVRKLLAPGGLLVLLEVTAPTAWIDLTFGLTDGWWRFAGRDALRERSPLLTKAGWIRLLGESGFEEPVAIPEREGDKGVLAQEALVLARAGAVLDADRCEGHWAIVADRRGVGAALARHIAAQGGEAALLENAPPPEALRGARGVLYLPGLDMEAPEATPGDELAGALAVVQSIVGLGQAEAPRLWIATRGAQPVAPGEPASAAPGALLGFGRAVALEHPETRCARIDLDPNGDPEADALALLDAIAGGDAEDEIALRGGKRYAPRLASGAGARAATAVRLCGDSGGTLDGLAYAPTQRARLKENEVEIRVRAGALNFRDVLNALSVRSDAEAFGGECAGTVERVGGGVEGVRPGDSVMAMGRGGLSAFLVADARLVVPRPERLGEEQAAGFAFAFLTAQYALHRIGRLARGERVLIHAAAGGVGMAAVQLARRAGAEIFATAGSEKKRAYLQSLGIQHVMDSRSLDFADRVMEATNGEGIDIVLNSLTGEAIAKGLSILRAGGRFLEIGKSELWDNARVAAVNAKAAYHAVDLEERLLHAPDDVRAMLLDLLGALGRGEIEPLPLRSFAEEETIEAFRYMARAEHIGKIVITRKEPAADVAPSKAFDLRADAAYLITGGLGGLGLAVADWMVERGARRLTLMGRSEPSERARLAIREMERRGARVHIVRGDVARIEDVRRALQADEAPLRGVFHAAGVVDPDMLERQTWERFEAVLAPKVLGAWNLHTLTLDASLDCFVLFSSVASLLGAPGQGAHGAACAYLDSLAHARRARGLPAVSINWGAWRDAGAAERSAVGARMSESGLGAFDTGQGLAALDRILRDNPPQAGACPIDWKRFMNSARLAPDRRFFSEMIQKRSPKPRHEEKPSEALLERLRCAPEGEREPMLLEAVRREAGKVLGIDFASPEDDARPLQEMGLDSLMAVELRNLLGSALGTQRPLSATLVFDHPTVAALTRYLLGELLGSGAPSPAMKSDAARSLDDLEELSDEEVDRLLAERMSGGYADA